MHQVATTGGRAEGLGLGMASHVYRSLKKLSSADKPCRNSCQIFRWTRNPRLPQTCRASDQMQRHTSGWFNLHECFRLGHSFHRHFASEELELTRGLILMLARGHGGFRLVQGVKQPVSGDLTIVVP